MLCPFSAVIDDRRSDRDVSMWRDHEEAMARVTSEEALTTILRLTRKGGADWRGHLALGVGIRCFDTSTLFFALLSYHHPSLRAIADTSLFFSPACIISFGLTALRRGELTDAWAWSDAPEEHHDERTHKTTKVKSNAHASVIIEPGIETLSRSTTPKEVKPSGGRR